MTIDYEGDKSSVYSLAGRGETFDAVFQRRLTRRDAIRGGLASSAAALAATRSYGSADAQEATPVASPAVAMSNSFEAVPVTTAPEPTVAAGHTASPFLRWGDAVVAGAPAFDPAAQTAAAQEMQFGYNCDWIGFLPLPQGSNASDHGLLVVNHEYTNPELMFAGYLTPNPDYVEGSEDIPEFLTNRSADITEVELAAHGMSVVEIIRDASNQWSVVPDSPYNRRLTATTPMNLTGPAAGAESMKTSLDATGLEVAGTLNNCAGGLTPWGTAVSGEENFHQYFGNLVSLDPNHPAIAIHARYGMLTGPSERGWEDYHDRFDLAIEPNESFRHGWAVEIDPYDPASMPKKRTALGRNKHEGFTSVVSSGGKVVVYSGDDERFDYVYKFVTDSAYNRDDRAANFDLLDSGTLYAAIFNDDGSGEWVPLTFGENGLTAEHGFNSQADVLINTRGAADQLGVTKMDRPEDIETNPVNKKVYMVMTNNVQRGLEENDDVNAANPRPENEHGHIIEVTEAGDDHAATTFTWEIFLLCGAPEDASTYYAGFPKEQVSPISAPDNIMFDIDGNLWISTDGASRTLEINDGLYMVPVDGPERGHMKLFLTGVIGGEVSGPEFNPDNTALFVSFQHPGEGGTFEESLTSWPDGNGPARPAVVVVTADDGGRVGT